MGTALIAGVVGVYTGISYGEFSVFIQWGQILAGVVQYPSEYPIGMVNARMWSLPYQIASALIWFEVSERTISIVFSGLITMVCFQAISLTTLAICDDTLTAILSPLLIYVVGATDFGVTYNVHIVSPESGTIGPAFGLLVFALWGNGSWRLASFCLGLSISIHPVVGVWCVCATFGGFILSWQNVSGLVRPLFPFFCAGLALTAASFAYQVCISAEAPRIDAGTASTYIRVFAEHWDYHRRPFPIWSLGTAIGLTSLVVSTYWAIRYRYELPSHVLLLLHILATSSVAGLALALLAMRPLDIPEILLRSIPGRHINLAILSYPSLVLGLVCFGNKWLGRWLVACISVVFLGAWLILPAANARMAIWVTLLCCGFVALVVRHLRLSRSVASVGWIALSPTVVLFAIAVFAGLYEFPKKLVLGVSLISVAFYLVTADIASWKRFCIAPRIRAVCICLSLVTGLVLLCSQSMWRWCRTAEKMTSHSTEPFLQRVSHQHGGLVSHAELVFPQVKVRRPILLQLSGIDDVMYVPASGPATNQIMREVYGVDLLDPDPQIASAHRQARLATNFCRELWESRSTEEWRRLAERFQFTGILVLSDWQLQLPKVCENDEYILFDSAVARPAQ